MKGIFLKYVKDKGVQIPHLEVTSGVAHQPPKGAAHIWACGRKPSKILGQSTDLQPCRRWLPDGPKHLFGSQLLDFFAPLQALGLFNRLSSFVPVQGDIHCWLLHVWPEAPGRIILVQ